MLQAGTTRHQPTLVPWTDSLRRLLGKHTKETLLSVVEEWFRNTDTLPHGKADDDDDDDSLEVGTLADYELLRQSQVHNVANSEPLSNRTDVASMAIEIRYELEKSSRWSCTVNCSPRSPPNMQTKTGQIFI
jgi:hypothetical protein